MRPTEAAIISARQHASGGLRPAPVRLRRQQRAVRSREAMAAPSAVTRGGNHHHQLQGRTTDRTAVEPPGCPMAALSRSLGLGPTVPHPAAPTEAQPRRRRRAQGTEEEVMVTPGPPALSLRSAIDVGQIAALGIQEAMLRFFARYGPVCRFANPVDLNGAAGWLMLNGPVDIEHVCSANVRNYADRYLPDIYKWVTDEKGILGSQGSYNRRHRRLCQPTFMRPNLLSAFSNIITERCRRLGDIYDGQDRPFQVDLATQTQRLTLDIVGKVAFSYDFKQIEQIHSELRAHNATTDGSQQLSDRLLLAVNRFGEVMAQVFVTPMPLLKLMDRVGMPQLKELRGSLDVIQEVMLGIVAERRSELAEDPEAEQSDLLGQLLTATDEDGNTATDAEVWHDIHDIMGAGHETTATTAAATIYCVSAHPEVEEKVLQELNSLGGEAPSYGDLERLPYLNQVVKEVLRMYPPIPLFPRQAAEADVLPSGHAVNAGDVVFMSSYTLGRDPTLWDQPMEFRPERFAPEEAAERHPCTWLPFGAGPRMCLGAGFAQMSVVLMAANLLQRHRFTPVRPNSKTLDTDYDITMNFGPTRGLTMEVSKRKTERQPRHPVD